MSRTHMSLAGSGLVVFLVALTGLGVHATYGARTTADEPYYLLTALSLAEDGSLDISDELADARYRPFHQAVIDPQTIPLDDSGREVSPHDPLLPVLLALPMDLGGWVGAKVALAALGGLLAALTVWVAVIRFGVTPPVAALAAVGFGATAPLAGYANQVYPELSAALAVLAAVACLTGAPTLRRSMGWLAAVVALPWLSIKYAPVAGVLALYGLWTLRPLGRRGVGWALAFLAVAGATYLALHQALYGGWTVYAAGDHFVDGELGVVGTDPDYLGRTQRLLGLLLDRGFGLAAWNPAWLIAVPATAAFARRGSHRALLGCAIGAGWATATWVALTMHGWWWPGRQVVVVLPLLVIVIARWVDGHLARVVALLGGLGLGALSWFWLVVETSTRRLTLIIDFEDTANPWYRAWRHALPDDRRMGSADVALSLAWLVGLAVVAGRQLRHDEDAGGGEGADTNMVTVDLHGGRAVRR